jgi:hypothetical protein
MHYHALTHALNLLEQAHAALAEAASAIRQTNDHDELAYAVMRLEADGGMLALQIRRARDSSSCPCCCD